MAATEIEPTQPIEVSHLCCLIYGQPGSRKTSLVQTADTPITLAFDPGIHRAYGRKKCAMFDTWADVIQYDTTPYKTVNADTVGMLLEKLSTAVIGENPKNGNRLGGLTLPGYGILKTRFAAWLGDLRQRQQDVILTAHEKSERMGDENYYCPDILGGSYNTIMNHADVVGYLHFQDGKRVLSFNPTDRFMAKCPPSWGEYTKRFMRGPDIVLPDFGAEPHFLATVLAEMKASMGLISAQSADTAKILEIICTWLQTEPLPTLENVNQYLKGDYLKLSGPVKAQVWKAISTYAKGLEWKADRKAGVFTQKETVPA